MAQLAIKGHATRGKEVIEILEMLGGMNVVNYDGSDNRSFYFLNNTIICSSYCCGKLLGIDCYTLEQFLEKFPYKIGDKVSSKYLKNYKIEKMEWEDTNNRVIYKLQGMGWHSADKLQLYKEETMEETKEDLCVYDKLDFEYEPCADKIELVLGDNYEVIVENGKTYVVRKKSQYPKTYEECCEVLNTPNDERYIDIDVPLDYNKLLYSFTKLLICRDAYWKIAGEQMGLGKLWEPDFTNDIPKYCFYVDEDVIEYDTVFYINHILSFPTIEMRDAFYENFNELIEQCKKLL